MSAAGGGSGSGSSSSLVIGGSNAIGMNRGGQVQVFQSVPEPETEAALKASQAQAAAAQQRAAVAALGKRSDDVISKPLNPQMAFEKFAGKVFDTSRSDFSDRVVKSQLRQLSSARTEFSALHPINSLNQALFESPLERYYRLQHEVKAFLSDLDALVKTEQNAKQASEHVRAITDVSQLLAADLKQIERELNGVAANGSYSAYLTPGSTGSGGATPATGSAAATASSQALLSTLQSVKDGKTDKKAAPAAAAASGDGKAVLEIYSAAAAGGITPEHTQQLDKRLALLEKLIGTPDSASASFPDIQTGLKTLGKKLELLDAQRLDSLYRRVKGVLTELEALDTAKRNATAGTAGPTSPTGGDAKTSDKSLARDTAHDEKVEQLYGMMTRWDAAAQSLPVVVARLQSLKEVHEECAGVIVRLQTVEKTAESAQKTIDDDRTALQTLSKNFSSNMQVIQNNVVSLENRFTALQAKIDQLSKLKIIS